MQELIAELIHKYVEDLKSKGALKSPAVEQAFRKVQRHRLLEAFFDFNRKTFVEVDPQNPKEEYLKMIYSDTPLVTRMVGKMPTSSTSQPSLVAMMLELLELGPGLRVLEIGAGTGYNAALIQEIVGEDGHVTTIDIQEDVVLQTARLLRTAGYERIEVIAADGFYGWPKNAPYDRIVATVGCPDISPHWVEQLAPGGFMIIPLQHGPEGHNPLVQIWKEGSHIRGRFANSSGFMSIQGALSWKEGLRFQDMEEMENLPISERSFPAELRGWPAWSSTIRAGFGLFLSIIENHRFVWVWTQDCGLFERGKGACVLTKETVLIYGNGEALYDRLVELAKMWFSLGRPGFDDWDLAFFWKGAALPEPEENVWILPRKFTVEVVRLKRGPGHNAYPGSEER